jgi:hypothetical protein
MIEMGVTYLTKQVLGLIINGLEGQTGRSTRQLRLQAKLKCLN